MAWALFSAYQAIVMLAVVQLQVLQAGAGAGVINKEKIASLVKAALPHYSAYVDQFGGAGYHELLEELEGRLLDELRNMLAGVETDRTSLQRAAEILRLSNAITESAKQGVHSAP
jgi:hypothetical protein